MPRDLEGLADIVVLTVKNAMAPALERIALLEKENGDLRQRLDVVTDLRDRVVVVETKAAMPLPIPVTTEVPPVDLSPVLERLAELERTTAEVRGVVFAPKPDLITPTDMELAIRKSLDPVLSDAVAVRERVVALEARAPIPGPAGKDGQNGHDGKDGSPGKDGADGLGFDDLDVEFDDRTLTLKFERGNQKKAWPITLPYLQYEGVYIDGKAYERGSVVTWAGSTWHANEQTSTKPGEGSKAWTLIVKRGRDGKDGRDALDPMPVVSVKR